jgi:MarR family transcriptional regulator, temperature-dependent positive regulator of motility
LTDHQKYDHQIIDDHKRDECGKLGMATRPGHQPVADNRKTIRFDANVPPVRRTPTPLARRFFQICVALSAEGVAGSGVTALEYAALPYLSKQVGDPGIDQIGLAARLGIDRNHTSLLIDQLEAKGLVERRVDPTDRRARRLYLTKKGERLFERLSPSMLAVNERILAPLEPVEREMLLDLLIRVIEGNWVHARPGAGRQKRVSGGKSLHKA